ncbi:phosphotransferase [Lichenifustis flavocetrariae]|uniref:Phosphotransferase n=1 Tax=Lichenifustis flavocetrariae TaxID=2949735 RepID=A0AA41YXG2_9HYPH|nr:phosphotransferase [Lichenifustis flavocetrariae]MCW6510379.1 phosphotransferase [Lichenifustis flavocetrariae]
MTQYAMAHDLLDDLSAQTRDAVRLALKIAFGSKKADFIAPLGGGASGAFPFRVEIEGRSYLVRVEGPASPLRNPHQYRSMRIAAEAGIAPKIYHIDESARVAVMDFVEERPLRLFPGGPHALAQAVGRLLASLQGTRPFPHFIEYPEMVGRLWWWVCQSGLFASGVLDPCTERLAQLRASYVWDTASSVSSHNDPVPRNILFDGERLWLIDWESAYRNDPLVDVAIALDGFARTQELEQALLTSFLGRRPEALTLERLTHARALTRLYYAGVLLSASAAMSGPLGDEDRSALSSSEFQRAVQSGQIIPGSALAKHTLGKMYLASFMTGDVPPGLDLAT